MITTEEQYEAILERIEELLKDADNIENQNAKGYIELNILSNLVVDYEEEYYPIKKPLLTEVVKLRMLELGLNQNVFQNFSVSVPLGSVNI